MKLLVVIIRFLLFVLVVWFEKLMIVLLSLVLWIVMLVMLRESVVLNLKWLGLNLMMLLGFVLISVCRVCFCVLGLILMMLLELVLLV